MVNKVQKTMESLGISRKGSKVLSVPQANYIPVWVEPKRKKLLESNPNDFTIVDLVVAKDGSGNFTSLTDALHNVTVRHDNSTVVIRIKEGVYA
jgi:pectinesterase